VGGTFDFLLLFSKTIRKQEDFNNIPDCYPFQKNNRNKRKKTVLSETLSTSPIGRHWHLMDRQRRTLTVDGVPSRITGQLFKFIFLERRRREYDNLPTLENLRPALKVYNLQFSFFLLVIRQSEKYKIFKKKVKKPLGHSKKLLKFEGGKRKFEKNKS
jgi:hypothetical protein